MLPVTVTKIYIRNLPFQIWSRTTVGNFFVCFFYLNFPPLHRFFNVYEEKWIFIIDTFQKNRLHYRQWACLNAIAFQNRSNEKQDKQTQRKEEKKINKRVNGVRSNLKANENHTDRKFLMAPKKWIKTVAGVEECMEISVKSYENVLSRFRLSENIYKER